MKANLYSACQNSFQTNGLLMLNTLMVWRQQFLIVCLSRFTKHKYILLQHHIKPKKSSVHFKIYQLSDLMSIKSREKTFLLVFCTERIDNPLSFVDFMLILVQLAWQFQLRNTRCCFSLGCFSISIYLDDVNIKMNSVRITSAYDYKLFV